MPEAIVDEAKTKEKQEAVVRSITRTCRGPKKLPESDYAALRAAWGKAEQSGDPKAVAAALDAVQVKLGIISRRRLILPEGASLEESLRAFSALLDSRRGCGYDFNKTIIAGGFDGQEKEYECPKCKLKGVYTAPRFD